MVAVTSRQQTSRPDVVLELFARIADEVAAALAVNEEWGESGARPGQYRIDVAVDRLCIEALNDAGLNTLSEESGVTTVLAGAPVVVVDPLDGSTNASRAIPWYATSLCLVGGGSPQVAMIANHATGQRFGAVAGGGGWCDDRSVRVSGCERLSEAIVGVSGLPGHHYGWDQYRSLGAAAADLCLLASGSIDAWFDAGAAGHGVWDYLAGLLICLEAGAVVTELDDRDLLVLEPAARRRPCFAASPSLLGELVAEHRRHGAGAPR